MNMYSLCTDSNTGHYYVWNDEKRKALKDYRGNRYNFDDYNRASAFVSRLNQGIKALV